MGELATRNTGTDLALQHDHFSRSDLETWAKEVQTDNKSILKIAKIVLWVVFGFGLFWASTFHLGGAVIASGRVIAENRNRVVQHLEGGILRELMVREGDSVSKGDVVARLDDTQVRAQLEAAQLQSAIIKVQLSRRQAEVAGTGDIKFPEDFPEEILSNPRFQDAIESQRQEYSSLRDYTEAKIQNLENSIVSTEKDIEGQHELLKAYDRQYVLYKKELEDFRGLLEEGHITQTKVNATDRKVAELEANIARSKIAIEQARGQIESLQNQIRQERLAYLNKANERIVELQKSLNQLDSQIERLSDMSDRSDLLAPVDGIVFRIGQRTVGGVVRAGESVMEIFPQDDQLTIEAYVQIKDIEQVHVGQDVQVVFPSNREKSMLPVDGKLIYLSADAVVSDSNPIGAYVAHVVLDRPEDSSDMLSGNVAEVYIKTEPKTFLQIIAKPFTRFAFRAFKG